jgi:hypothetical protein
MLVNPDINGVVKLHYRMFNGLWLCEGDGLTGIGLTPDDAQQDWTMELLADIDASEPQKDEA